MVECALCGVALTDDTLDESPLLILTQNAGVLFHPWCLDTFLERVVFLPTRSSDQSAVIEAHMKGEP
jgi:hypothetical protein